MYDPVNQLPRKGLDMLLLSRSAGEKLRIGDSVTVTVLGFKGNQVFIGIDAPREIQVDRVEWLNRDVTGTEISLQRAV